MLVIKNGVLSRLHKPMDFRGEICGKAPYEDRKYLYFDTPSIDLNVAHCVEYCPDTTVNPQKI